MIDCMMKMSMYVITTIVRSQIIKEKRKEKVIDMATYGAMINKYSLQALYPLYTHALGVHVLCTTRELQLEKDSEHLSHEEFRENQMIINCRYSSGIRQNKQETG